MPRDPPVTSAILPLRSNIELVALVERRVFTMLADAASIRISAQTLFPHARGASSAAKAGIPSAGDFSWFKHRLHVQSGCSLSGQPGQDFPWTDFQGPL